MFLKTGRHLGKGLRQPGKGLGQERTEWRRKGSSGQGRRGRQVEIETRLSFSPPVEIRISLPSL